MFIFNREKHIARGYNDRAWTREADGHEVKDGRIVGTPFEWEDKTSCIEVRPQKKYKPGDKVLVKNERGQGWNLQGKMDKYKNKVMTVKTVAGHTYTLENGEDWYFMGDSFWGKVVEPEAKEKPKPKCPRKIQICFDGNRTLAVCFDNGKRVHATARCNPADEYDPAIGAKLAIERLFEKLNEPEKQKYYSGKVVCIWSEYSWLTVGKVYEVKDGIFKCDDGSQYPRRGYEPYKNAEDLRHAGCSGGDARHNPKNEFVPLVEG